MSKDKIPPMEMKTEGDEALENSQYLASYLRIEGFIKNLSGEILTIIDASVVDGEQKKAIKDLVKGRIRNTLNSFQLFCFEGKRQEMIEI